MKITGKLVGDMTGFSLKHNPENGARFAHVKLAIDVDRELCGERFGSEFAKIAFGSLQVSHGGEEEGAAGVSFGYKQMTPAVICEFHEVQILGHTQKVQPLIKTIVPVKDKEEVTVSIELPILIKKDKELSGALCAQFGELVEIEIDPSQQELDFDGDSENGGSVVITRGRFGNNQAAVVD
jgi:hypothetical protein